MSENGQIKCEKCGSTDISQNPKTGKLRCNYCRYEFEPEKSEEIVTDAGKLEGEHVNKGAEDITAGEDIVTLKCSSCGAEVVIDTRETTQARCHWCRNTLSVNSKVANGAVPDVVLPFKITKDEAKSSIENFVGKRKFFANKQFKNEFSIENVMGVYFPYMIVDANEHVELSGEAEKEVKQYKKDSKDSVTYYDAQGYDIEREFDIAINGLTIEASRERIDNASSIQTNNIVNSIMPFDTENCVKFDSNYLRGYTSEKRDMNVKDIEPLATKQIHDISRIAAKTTTKKYNRGVRWDVENYENNGINWNASYLPVWLYSYLEKKNEKERLHYVAVNGRTGETMGSVPIDISRLLLVSFIVEIISFVIFALWNMNAEDSDFSWIVLLAGIAFYIINFMRYRNSDARHNHETETNYKISNLIQKDNKQSRVKKGLTESDISGRNDSRLECVTNYGDVLGDITDMGKELIKKL